MAEHLNHPESSDSISLLTASVSELIREQWNPLELNGLGYLYRNIESILDFEEVFKRLDKYVGNSLRDCRCEQLVAAIVADENCPATEGSNGCLEKKLCRYLEDTFDPVQNIQIILNATGSKPARAVITFEQSVLNRQTATVEINYNPDGEVGLKTTQLRIPAEGDKKPLTLNLTEDYGSEYFIRRVGITESECGKDCNKLHELHLDQKLCMRVGQGAKTEVIHKVVRKTKDKVSGKTLAEESKPIVEGNLNPLSGDIIIT